MSNNIVISRDLFIAINNLCTGVESKILFTIIGHEHDSLFTPSSEYMMNMTGLTQKNHYFVNRKKLMDKGYIQIGADGMRVNMNAILQDYKEEFTC